MFLRQKLTSTYINEEEYESYLEWSCTNGEIIIRFPVQDMDVENITDYVLIAVDDVTRKNDTKDIETNDGRSKDVIVEFAFHPVSPECESDWNLIIDSFLQRSSDDLYRYMELLWSLERYNWDGSFLLGILGKYDIESRATIFKCLQHISRCLSLNKQLLIKEVLGYFGKEYNVYHPDIIFSLIHKDTDSHTDPYELDLFAAVDSITARETDLHAENHLLQVLYWLRHPENVLRDYGILPDVYSYVSEEMRLDIVKRYFHDIRKGQTKLETLILEQFKDNPHSSLSIYRYCISTPGEPIDLSTSLMCDCILTLMKSGGKFLQTFNGLMDLAISKCNRALPFVNFKLEKLFPVCHGGSLINRSFVGFIDYSVLYSINEKKLFDKKALAECAVAILNSHAKRVFYYTFNPECSYNTVIWNRPVDIDTNKLCVDWKKLIRINIDKWEIRDQTNNLVQKLVNGILAPGEDVFDLERADINMLSKNIRDIVVDSLLPEKEGKTFSLKTTVASFVMPFIVPEKIRITPHKNCRLGRAYERVKTRMGLSSGRELMPTEEQEIYTRIIDSLKSNFGLTEYNGEYFETDYDPALLARLCSVYYYNKTGNSIQFLFDARSPKYIVLCAPKAASECSQAISLPYFWCMGKECFHNALDRQSLVNELDWHRYTAFHLFEIAGYPEIHERHAGYEPEDTIRAFIALSNNVLRKFNSMRCRACGHLLFPDHPGSVYQYNYFSCRNPYCTECGKTIYLNYCFKCKKGLIDSRDTNKCPNGWYICPKCLSCCDDQQYDRMKQRYVLQHLPVPQRVAENVGRGHNDKNMYFCPKCGKQLEIVGKNGNMLALSCKFCKSSYAIRI